MKLYVIETETGAQVLPSSGDTKAHILEWAAFCTMNADLRNTSPAHMVLASKLHIRIEEEEDDQD